MVECGRLSGGATSRRRRYVIRRRTVYGLPVHALVIRRWNYLWSAGGGVRALVWWSLRNLAPKIAKNLPFTKIPFQIALSQLFCKFVFA